VCEAAVAPEVSLPDAEVKANDVHIGNTEQAAPSAATACEMTEATLPLTIFSFLA